MPTHFKIQASVDQKKLPKKSVKEMESEVYLNLFGKWSSRINFDQWKCNDSILNNLRQLFITILWLKINFSLLELWVFFISSVFSYSPLNLPALHPYKGQGSGGNRLLYKR